MLWKQIGTAAAIAFASVALVLIMLWKADERSLGTWLLVREPDHRGLRRLLLWSAALGVAVFGVSLVALLSGV